MSSLQQRHPELFGFAILALLFLLATWRDLLQSKLGRLFLMLFSLGFVLAVAAAVVYLAVWFFGAALTFP